MDFHSCINFVLFASLLLDLDLLELREGPCALGIM